jgi:predicted anti-sigma-YlaC factor YlaD
MTHLTEEMLNAFLDYELLPDERAAAAAHLAECARCRSQLDALQGMLAALAALRTEPIPIDLTSRVLAQTRVHSALPRVAVLLAAQSALAALLAIWLAPLFGQWSAAVLQLVVPGTLPVLEFPVGLDSSWSDIAAAWSGISSDLAQAVSALAIAPLAWTIAIAAAAVVWLAGNRWLLGGRIRQ